MLEQRVHRLAPAVHDVEHARRQSGFRQQLRQLDRRRGIFLARLEHERVPARERDRKHPHRHHRREVERRDPDAHAERLADRDAVDLARDVLGNVAFEQVRDPAGELDDLEPALDLTPRVGERLAVLGGDQRCDPVGVAQDQLAEPEQHRRATQRRRLRPLRQRAARRPHRGVHLVRAGERDAPGKLPGRRIVDVPRPAGSALDRAPPDEVA